MNQIGLAHILKQTRHRLLEPKRQALSIVSRSFSDTKPDKERKASFLQLVKQKIQKDNEVKANYYEALKLEEGRTTKHSSLKFITRIPTESEPSTPTNSLTDGNKSGVDFQVTEVKSKQFKLEESDLQKAYRKGMSFVYNSQAFLQYYDNLLKKQATASTEDTSKAQQVVEQLKILKKLFYIKNIADPSDVARLESILEQILDKVLMEFALTEQPKIHELNEKALQPTETSSFEIFVQSITNPFQIAKCFYLQESLVTMLLTKCFQYLAALNDQAKAGNMWAVHSDNRKFVTALCNQLKYVFYKAPASLKSVKAAESTPKINEEEAKFLDTDDFQEIGLISLEENQEGTRFNYQLLKTYAQNYLDLKIKELEHDLAVLKASKPILKAKSPSKEEEEATEVTRYKNSENLFQIKLVSVCSLLNDVLSILNIVSTKLILYYDLFDNVHYFLVKFFHEIDVGQQTAIIFQLIKKNSQKRNEDLLYLYRQKVHSNLKHIGQGQLQNAVFILSRSYFPFQEILFQELFYQTPTYTKMISKLKGFEIGSIIPSFAKVRYTNQDLLDKLCYELLNKLKADIKQVQPMYLKVFVERLMALQYNESPSAQEFFKQIISVIEDKTRSLELQIREKLSETQLKQCQDEIDYCSVIKQYCLIKIKNDAEPFKVELLVDKGGQSASEQQQAA